METMLTRQIKNLTHIYRPKMNGAIRTIRWADEVWTPTGIVDSIRFEDYVIDSHDECKRINYQSYLLSGDALITQEESAGKALGECKIPGQSYPNKNCRGCFFNVYGAKTIGVMVICFEVKISYSDFMSRNGHNFHGNENYYCVPKSLTPLIKSRVPDDIGILEYYESKRSSGLRCIKPSGWREVDMDTKFML